MVHRIDQDGDVQSPIMDFLSKPVIAGGLVLGYEYFMNKNSYNNTIMKHLPSAGIVAASSVAGDLILSKMSFGSSGMKELEKTLAKPVSTGLLYASGRKYILNKNSFLKDGLVGGTACIVSGYVSPIDKYF